MYRFFLVCFFVFLLSSCTQTQTLQPFQIARGCPDIRFALQAYTVVRFGLDSCIVDGDGRCILLEDMISRAAFVDFDGTCVYRREDLLEVTLNVVIVVQKGGAFTGTEETYTYTLAIITPDDEILGQRQFRTTFLFEEGTDISTVQEQLVQHIPLSPEALGQDYKILLGFTLTADQLKYNQKVMEEGGLLDWFSVDNRLQN